MAALIYSLCALTSLLCAWLLLRTYKKQHNALLFWCGLFFAVQTVMNVLLVLDDRLMVPEMDLSLYHYGIAFTAICILLYGLIMRTEVE